MVLWYAYRMDIQTNGFGNTALAPGCRGSVPGGSCYFDEFLRHIQTTGAKTNPWPGSTSVGTNLKPDVTNTALELYLLDQATTNQKNQYKNLPEARKLFPASFSGPTTFVLMWDKVVDDIQFCRQTKTDAFFTDELSAAREAMTGVHKGRQKDLAPHVIKGVNADLVANGFTWEVETKTVQVPGMGSWEEMDTAETLAQHPNEPQDVRDAVKNYVRDYSSTDKLANSHVKAFQHAQVLETRLLGGSDC